MECFNSDNMLDAADIEANSPVYPEKKKKTHKTPTYVETSKISANVFIQTQLMHALHCSAGGESNNIHTTKRTGTII